MNDTRQDGPDRGKFSASEAKYAQPPRIIGGRYRVGPLIGQGSMGTVFKAQHTLTRQDVALKLIHHGATNHGLVKARFEREIGVSAKVDHDGIVRVFDAGEEPDGTLYLAMELLVGHTLQQRSGQSEFTPHYGLRVVMAMLEPLAAAHDAGIVHRDIKPENIFLHQRPGGQEQVKLLDFGIAKDPRLQSNTRTDVGLGTPYYMSPEQATSARDVTAASDIWSVGVILYWLLCGRLPFEGETPFDTLTKVCTTDPRPLDLHEGQTTRQLVELTLAMLNKDPTQRPQNASALLGALHQILGTGTSDTSQPRLRFASSLNLQEAWSTQGVAPREPGVISGAEPDLSEGPAVSPMATATLTASVSTEAPARSTNPVTFVAAALLVAAIATGGYLALQRPPRAPLQATTTSPEPTPAPATVKPELPRPTPEPRPLIEATEPAPKPTSVVPRAPSRRAPRPRRARPEPQKAEIQPAPTQPIVDPVVPPPRAVQKSEPLPPPPPKAVQVTPKAPTPKLSAADPVETPAPIEVQPPAKPKPKKKKEQPFLSF